MVFPIAGGTQSTGDLITNSLRFNNDDDPYLLRTPSSTGDQRTFTFSVWLKQAFDQPSGNHVIFSAGSDGDNYDQLRIKSNGFVQFESEVSDSVKSSVYTTHLFRDPTAWYHLVLRVDTTQSTAADRVRFYKDGTLLEIEGGSQPDQNQQLNTNTQIGHAIGTLWRGSNSGNEWDGYMANAHFADGQSYAPTQFGETNSNGVWVPKQFAGSFGTNGFKLEFKQTGTSANAAGIGADTGSNGHHHSLNGLAAVDVTTDTPQNNFATLNPLDRHANVVLSEGNLQTVNTSGGGHYPIFTNMAFKNGKWYGEFKRADGNNWKAAIMSIDHDGGSLNVDSTVGNSTSPVNRAGYGINVDDGNKTHYDGSSFLNQSYGSEIGSILMWAFDADNGKIWWGEDGTFFASGDPAAGTNAAFTSIDTDTNWTLAFHTYNGHNLIANFGNAPFSISSGHSDDNGHGNFEFEPPSGFLALCTKNLAETG